MSLGSILRNCAHFPSSIMACQDTFQNLEVQRGNGYSGENYSLPDGSKNFQIKAEVLRLNIGEMHLNLDGQTIVHGLEVLKVLQN